MLRTLFRGECGAFGGGLTSSVSLGLALLCRGPAKHVPMTFGDSANQAELVTGPGHQLRQGPQPNAISQTASRPNQDLSGNPFACEAAFHDVVARFRSPCRSNGRRVCPFCIQPGYGRRRATVASGQQSRPARAPAETIEVDAGSPGRPFPHFWERMFGSGRAILTLRESYRRDLRDVKEATDFEYVRFHAIFHDEVGVYQEDSEGRATYNFSYLDQIYDGLLANGIRPF